MTQQIAFNLFQGVAESWSLTRQERAVLLNSNEAIYDEWCRNADNRFLSSNQLLRISFVIDIYDATHRMFGDAELANDWVHQVNVAFNQKPLDMMLKDGLNGMSAVHEYIEGVVANW